MKSRTPYIPKDPEQVIESTKLNAVVYYTKFGDKPGAVGFYGRAVKPTFMYSFKEGEEARQRYVDGWFDRLNERLKSKAESKLEQALRTAKFLESLKPGVILYDTWGYDQTNVEFYVVKERKGSKVLIQEIGCKSVGEPTSWASDKVIPGDVLEDKSPIWKNVRSCSIKIDSCVYLKVWDGDERGIHRSWYA